LSPLNRKPHELSVGLHPAVGVLRLQVLPHRHRFTGLIMPVRKNLQGNTCRYIFCCCGELLDAAV
jgi:hypothetical protein